MECTRLRRTAYRRGSERSRSRLGSGHGAPFHKAAAQRLCRSDKPPVRVPRPVGSRSHDDALRPLLPLCAIRCLP